MSWPGGMVAAEARWLLLAALLLWGWAPAVASAWRDAPADGVAIMLPADGRLYPARLRFDEPLFDEDIRASDARLGRHAGRVVYMAHVAPGRAYTLGVRVAGRKKPRLEARLYDRWPGDPDAKSWPLRTGPRLMSNPRFVEYDWHLSVAKDSPGTLMYLVLGLRDERHSRGRASVRAFLVTPPIKPMRERGRGVTYLRGPEQIRLAERGERLRIVRVVESADTWRGPGTVADAGRIPNGDFSAGLEHWRVFPEPRGGQETGVAAGIHGLRLWASRLRRPAGVEQRFEPALALHRGGRLVLRFRIGQQAQRDGFGSLDDFPLRVDVECAGSGKRPGRVVSRAYSVVAPQQRALAERTDVVPERAWVRRALPLPAGCRIRAVRLSGGGLPEREAVVSRVDVARGNQR